MLLKSRPVPQVGKLKPDLISQKGTHVMVLDIAVCHENLLGQKRDKIEQYRKLKNV